MDQLKLNSAVNANLQNTINTSLILNHVRKLGTTYRSEISKALNLSLPAVSRAVDRLIESGYLIERKIITKLGRQAHEVEINALLGVSIGISIELPTMKIARMDMAGRIATVEEIILDTGGKRIEELVMEQLEYFLKQRQFIDDREVPVVALTIAVPAAIDLDRGEVYAVLYRNMKELNINPESIGKIVISHAHGDHTGGFHGFSDFKRLSGLSRIVPCHCTQHKSKILKMFPDVSLECGAGLVLEE